MRAISGAGVIAMLMAGCLTEGQRGQSEVADGTSDADTVDADTGATDGDTSGGDTATCTDQGCDDQDPCTVDRCNPETGVCEHLGAPTGEPGTGCLTNADCEDGDPCTKNSCVSISECGVATSLCVSDVIVGCNDCASGCDDQDPCTTDSCLDGVTCMHDALEGCMPECVTAGVVPIATIRTQPITVDKLKTVGEVFFHPLGQGCNDGPTCDCTGFPGLRDGGFDLALRAPQTTPGVIDPSAWTCTSTGCQEPVPTCSPALAGVRYKMWGRGLAEWELAGAPQPAGADGGAAVPVQLLAGLEVQGYCLETVDKTLVGKYDGTIDVAGSILTFQAAILDTDGGLAIEWESATCAGCPANLTGARVPLTVGDGWVELEATLPTITGEQPSAVHLSSNHNQLIGRYRPGAGPIPFVAIRPDALMTLTRHK